MHLKLVLVLASICELFALDANVTETEEIDLRANETAATNRPHATFDNATIKLEDIVQPIYHVEERHVRERAVQTRGPNKTLDFKPSPQLAVEYEYNRVPVRPALPEAKFFANPLDASYSTNFLLTDEDASRSTEPPWISRVRFPERDAAPIKSASHDQPYPFYLDNSQVPTAIKSSGSVYESKYQAHAIDNAYRESNKNVDYHQQEPAGFLDFDTKANPQQHHQHASNSGLSLKSNWGETFTYERPKPNLSILSNPIASYGKFPWKKIVKFLTAALPIGLLLSALTPSVITIQDTNATSRIANPDNGREVRTFVKSLRNLDDVHDKDVCKERAFCELYVKMKSSNGTVTYINNLMEVLNKKVLQQAEETYALKKVLDAVHNNHCEILECHL